METERHPVVDYEGIYEVDRNGNIFNIKNGKNIKSILNIDGYIVVNLHNNGIQNNHKVHYIVAKAWIPNPSNLPQVNHINGIKIDNRVENLEWCLYCQK